MTTYLFDACALVALLTGEPGSDIVRGIWQDAKESNAALLMNKINLLEVYYDVLRRLGVQHADAVLQKIESSPVIVISALSDSAFKEAGRLKSTYKISLADAIALGESIARRATLITADHHEMDTVEGNLLIKSKPKIMEAGKLFERKVICIAKQALGRCPRPRSLSHCFASRLEAANEKDRSQTGVTPENTGGSPLHIGFATCVAALVALQRCHILPASHFIVGRFSKNYAATHAMTRE